MNIDKVTNTTRTYIYIPLELADMEQFKQFVGQLVSPSGSAGVEARRRGDDNDHTSLHFTSPNVMSDVRGSAASRRKRPHSLHFT